MCACVCACDVTLLLVRAESATKTKLEKVAEIKRLNAQIMAIKRCSHHTYRMHAADTASHASACTERKWLQDCE